MSLKETSTTILEVKSKFDAEFRRFSVDCRAPLHFADLYNLLKQLHGLVSVNFVVQYSDREDDLLPINNDDNYRRALHVTRGLLRLLVQRKGESYGEHYGYGPGASGRRGRVGMAKLLTNGGHDSGPGGSVNSLLVADSVRRITLLDDFRRVSSIIDVDVVPDMHRRVKLLKSGAKPLGFYIRDGTSIRVTPGGIEKVPGIFISRLLPGGLAESTGLLAVNDEVIEVNGIEVMGKTLDQVTDMMVANSSNLIITVKPVNQSTCLPRRPGSTRLSNLSSVLEGGGSSGGGGNVGGVHSNSSSVGSANEMGVAVMAPLVPPRQHLYEKHHRIQSQTREMPRDDDVMTL